MPPKPKKVRLNIEVTPQQRKLLKAIAAELETSLSAISRASLDEYIKSCLENPDLQQIKVQISSYLSK